MVALPSKILSCSQRPPRSRFHLQPENSVLPQPSSISRTQLGPTLALSFLPLFSLVLIEQSSTDNHPRVKHKQVYPVVHVIKLKMVTGGVAQHLQHMRLSHRISVKAPFSPFGARNTLHLSYPFQRFVPNFIPVANLAVSLGSSGRQKMSSGTLCGTPGPGRCLHPYIASPKLASP